MKRIPALLMLMLTAASFLTGASAETHFALRARGCGPMKTLTGSTYVVCIFVSTPSHPWTEKKKQEVYNVFGSSVRSMKKQASRYRTSLDLTDGYLELKINREYDKDLAWYYDLLKEVYHENSIVPVCSAYARDLHVDNAPIVFLFNSWDISHTYICTSDYPQWKDEFCVIFCATKMHDNYLTHELLHQFGAIDLYDYNQEGVEKVAKKYFPSSDMLTVSHVIDDLTAYLVGWTDTLSAKAQKFLKETEGLR